MKNMTKLLTVLLTLAVLFGAMTLTASAAQFSEEDAFAYLDSYADNVGVDEMNTWGCYFYMEALHRLLDPEWKLYW